MLIFETSQPGRQNGSQIAQDQVADNIAVPDRFLRGETPQLPEVSELQAVRHYTRLSQLNYAIDTHFYPLGSCTMKYNPRACNGLSMLPGFLRRHPLAPDETGQGLLACLFELQEMLKTLTGMAGISLTPLAGAQGEFAGVAMIRAYHTAHGDMERNEILIPDAAHGTNPATAAMCGYKTREIPTKDDGDIDLSALREAVGPHTAGLMLTNPSTLGVFERQIEEVARVVHHAGGLLYYDGANLNAILGKVRPGDMGFDVIHLNLHKTFSTPHGGGGPGSGPVGASKRLLPFLPVPHIVKREGLYRLLQEQDCPQSIGRLSAYMGNVGVLLRAYVYARLLGRAGMSRVADYATLNANYLLKRLSALGYKPAYPQRRASHEFVLSLKALKDKTGATALDVAKRLLDKGFYAPTVYFPLLIAECMLIEPTETESKETLDDFIKAMGETLQEAENKPEKLTNAPQNTPSQRLDEIKAAKELDLTWKLR